MGTGRSPDPGAVLGRHLLIELVERLAACRGLDTYFTAAEVAQWPAEFAQAARASGLLAVASPAGSAECPGCEAACVMPVEIIPGRTPELSRALIYCDKRDDIVRVEIPFGALERFKSSGDLLAGALAKLLDLQPARPVRIDGPRWSVGQFSGDRHKNPLVLSLDMKPALALSGHTVLLTDVLRFGKGAISLDVAALRKLVDNPTGKQAQMDERGQERADRFRARMAYLKAKGVRAYRVQAAKEAGIDPSRVGQLLRKYPAKKMSPTWHPEPVKASRATPAKKPKR